MQTTFDEYSTGYRHVRMQREAGVLEMRLHSDDGPLVWGAGPHSEFGHCFADVGSDPENRVIILTGTGDRFIADLDKSWIGEMTPTRWDEIYRNGKRLGPGFTEGVTGPLVRAAQLYTPGVKLTVLHAEVPPAGTAVRGGCSREERRPLENGDEEEIDWGEF